MSNQEKDRLEEIQRMDAVIAKIQHAVDQLETDVYAKQENVTEMRKSFWSDLSVNTANWDDILETYADIMQQSRVVADHERTYRHSKSALDKLKRLMDSPYFGRVDFIEEGTKEVDVIYLGTSSFLDEDTGIFLIYDWRAPISSLFYDYSPGPAAFQAPGGIVQGTLELKRQFVIQNGTMKFMFDTGVTIADEVLQQVLGKHADTQMKSIVATIQREQNEIIRNDRAKTVLVQGVAGSGKTSVALQRIAYLLYKYRAKITSDNMVLFSPNPLFKHYVSNVLPELGETNVQQTTFFEYLEYRLGDKYQLEHPFEQLEYLLTAKESLDYVKRAEGLRYKATVEFYTLMEDYTQDLNQDGMIFKDIYFQNRVLISANQIKEQFYSDLLSQNLPERTRSLRNWIKTELNTFEKSEAKKEWVREEIEFLEEEDYHRIHKQIVKRNKKKEASFDDGRLEERLLRKLVTKRAFKLLYALVEEDDFIDYWEIYQQLLRKNGLQIELSNKGMILQEDAYPFFLLKELVEGFKTFDSIRYVVIDEAQDYSPFQFRLIKKIFPYSRWTILGDIHQSVWVHPSWMSPENKMKILQNEDSVESYEMLKTYRSTKEIVMFTQGILYPMQTKPIEPLNRRGEVPTISIVIHLSELKERLLQDIANFQIKGHQSIAIICKTAKECLEAYELLKAELQVQLITKDIYTYKQGIIVIPVYLAKGVEFDAVLIFNGSKEDYWRDTERNLFYTACTRALHELHVYSLGELSPFIKQIDPKAYVMKSDQYRRI